VSPTLLELVSNDQGVMRWVSAVVIGEWILGLAQRLDRNGESCVVVVALDAKGRVHDVRVVPVEDAVSAGPIAQADESTALFFVVEREPSPSRSRLRPFRFKLHWFTCRIVREKISFSRNDWKDETSRGALAGETSGVVAHGSGSAWFMQGESDRPDRLAFGFARGPRPPRLRRVPTGLGEVSGISVDRGLLALTTDWKALELWLCPERGAARRVAVVQRALRRGPDITAVKILRLHDRLVCLWYQWRRHGAGAEGGLWMRSCSEAFELDEPRRLARDDDFDRDTWRAFQVGDEIVIIAEEGAAPATPVRSLRMRRVDDEAEWKKFPWPRPELLMLTSRGAIALFHRNEYLPPPGMLHSYVLPRIPS
jgi:hypothetical protein